MSTTNAAAHCALMNSTLKALTASLPTKDAAGLNSRIPEQPKAQARPANSLVSV
jgi:hypothetical protein